MTEPISVEKPPVIERFGVAIAVFFVLSILNLLMLSVIFAVVFRNGQQIWHNTRIIDEIKSSSTN